MFFTLLTLSQVNDIREKNLDLMRPELITVLKHSQFCIVRELAGADPVAVFRWAMDILFEELCYNLQGRIRIMK